MTLANYTQSDAAMSETTATQELDRNQLAEVLGVEPHTVSAAAHGQFFCRGYPLHEWAVWHPRGNEVQYYEVPICVIQTESSEEKTRDAT